jgi:exonuclease III
VAAHYDAGPRFADCLRIDEAQVRGDSCARLRRTAERRGLIANVTKVTEKRFKGVTDKIAASDHCPVAIDLTV